ncbi:MAG: PH domain-containing protein [Clostridia bacterium]|nr:PH domain-containing protein [Clostridia bacterium]MBQ1553957.1 PH domain-containing protein [Clostridia bacterium]MBQ4396424.1 PH domain-containing protein [Clostridia bacterium]MBQ5544294.1 PH domain-containing protein [Clostridia bacterium]
MAKKPKVEQETELIRERKRLGFFGLPFSFTTFAITEKKLIYKKGLLSSIEDEILLYRVQDITVRRTLGQKLFGLGTLEIDSQDKTCPHLTIKNIKHVKEFRAILSEQVEKEKTRRNFRSTEILDGDNDPGFHGGMI